MASNDRKRQQKLERKAAKRKDKKHQMTVRASGGLPSQLATAHKYPILHSLMNQPNGENGLSSALISRLLPNGQVMVASFLVDRWCLGVKDSVGSVVHRLVYDQKFEDNLRRRMHARDVPPEEVAKFVKGAVAYSHSLGIAPHEDYATASLLLSGIDDTASQTVFEFGKDGKPFYFAGPYDIPQRVRRILSILTNSCGAGGYHYTIPYGGSDIILRDLPTDDEFDSDDEVEQIEGPK
jgi:hypothetical protein